VLSEPNSRVSRDKSFAEGKSSKNLVAKMELSAMMHESIWFEKPHFEQDETNYQLYLARNSPKGTTSAAAPLIDEIVKARTSIKKSLNEGPGNKQKSEKSVDALEKENQELRSLIVDLTKRMESVELRLAKVEGKSTVQEGSAKPKDDDTGDDEFDLFASDEEDGEDDKEADEERKKLLDKYHDKKAKKAPVIAKSNIILDIKPWADDTDMVEMEKLVRGIKTDGLVWGASKLVPVAFGIKKLQIACVVEDDKVGTDYLEEKIQEFDDHVQSVDVAAFNKV